MKDHQRLYAGAARSRDTFCIAVVEPDSDDPFSYLLSYDGSFPQPWARVDVRRVVNSITAAAGPSASCAAVRPTTLSRIATPLKVQAVDDVLFYFDYNQGVHRFDGSAWEEIPIPPELLERSFKGLSRPSP